MVSYLLLAVLAVGIIIVGFAYGIISDVVGYIIPQFSSVSNSLGIIPDSETTNIFNILIMLFNNFLIIALIIFVYYVLSMSQKPVKPY